MAQLQKNRWESKPQAEQRIQKEQLEDQLINQFIADLEPKDWGTGNHAEYNYMSSQEQRRHDLKSFKFFAEKHENAKVNNQVYDGIEFENFLKVDRPEINFEKELRTPDAGEISTAWVNVYGSNSNLMKASALKGQMISIAAADRQEKFKQQSI
jgi:hypothetical protein